MKPTFLLLAALTGVAFSGTLPWPIGPDGTQSDTRTLLNTYGSPNNTWLNVYYNPGPPGVVNFHAGIDIKAFDDDPYTPDDQVFPIESGYLIDIPNDAPVEFSDGTRLEQGVHYTLGYSASSADGWCYQHLIEWPLWTLGMHFTPSQQLSLMDPAVPTTHLHLMWADSNYNAFEGCDFDPLTELSFLSGFNWNWRENRYAVKLTDQMPISDWVNISGLDDILIPHDNVSGPVDIMFEYYFEGLGVMPGITIPSDDKSVTPERIEWAVFRETQSGVEEVFKRYVMNFDMENLGNQSCCSKYLLHYFRWFRPLSGPDNI